MTSDESALASIVQSYWSAFARSGNPGKGSIGVSWLASVPGNDNYLQIVREGGDTTQVMQNVNSTLCDWWDAMKIPGTNVDLY
jgi:hypothetical protein